MRDDAPEDCWADLLIVTRGLPPFLERTVGTPLEGGTADDEAARRDGTIRPQCGGFLAAHTPPNIADAHRKVSAADAPVIATR